MGHSHSEAFATTTSADHHLASHSSQMLFAWLACGGCSACGWRALQHVGHVGVAGGPMSTDVYIDLLGQQPCTSTGGSQGYLQVDPHAEAPENLVGLEVLDERTIVQALKIRSAVFTPCSTLLCPQSRRHRLVPVWNLVFGSTSGLQVLKEWLRGWLRENRLVWLVLHMTDSDFPV
jgi:hypothetical protein